METRKYKRLPYGNSDFKDIILNNYAYMDKTRYIEMLEQEANRNQFFIRPRKFGKNLFFTTLLYYYDLLEAENFDKLFGDLYIGKHPTPEHNTYAVMKFDFSGLNMNSEEGFKTSFSSNVQDAVRIFFRLYEHVFPEADLYVRQIDEEKPGIMALQILLAYLFMSRIYVPTSEYETVPGSADIYLQRSPLLPQVKYEWLLELKYCKTSAPASEIAAKREEGLEQINRYARSHRMKDRTDLKAALIVFIGKDKFKITEI
jgi:hypothetical protein